MQRSQGERGQIHCFTILTCVALGTLALCALRVSVTGKVSKCQVPSQFLFIHSLFKFGEERIKPVGIEIAEDCSARQSHSSTHR